MGFCLHRPPSLLASPTSTDTPPEEGGRILGLSRGVDVSAPPPVACGGQCFLWSLAGAERLLSAIFCPARQPLPTLWQRASFCACPRFWVADFFSPKAGISAAQSSPQHCSWGSRVFTSPLLRVFLLVFYSTSRGKCAHSTFTRAEVWLLPHFIRV